MTVTKHDWEYLVNRLAKIEDVLARLAKIVDPNGGPLPLMTDADVREIKTT